MASIPSRSSSARGFGTRVRFAFLSIAFLASLCAAGLAPASAREVPVDVLLEGVASIHTSGVPATLVVTGDDAEVLVAAPDGAVIAAAATVGSGRVVALGHGGFLGSDVGDTARFRANVFDWLTEGARRVRVFGLDQRAFEENGLADRDGVRVDGDARTIDLDSVDLIVGSVQRFTGREDALFRWLRSGGRLLATETAWGQLQLKRAERVEELACNRLMAREGVSWTSASKGVPAGGFSVDRERATSSHAGRALDRVLDAGPEGDGVAADDARLALAALRTLADDAPLRRRFDRDVRRRRAELNEAWSALDTKPIDFANAPFARIAIDLDADRLANASPREIRAHASAGAFPGAIAPGARAVTRRLDLETSIPGWRTTGLWATPGDRIEVRVEDDLVDAGAFVQIGAWRDPQQFDRRVRLRQAIWRVPIDGRRVEAASPIGGPVYIDLPAGLDADTVRVEIRGAIEQPRFRLGHTTDEEWARLREAPAPWAELETDELVFTIPASFVRALDDPTTVMEHWDRVHTAMQELEPRSPRHWPDRQYRYVADARLSWGYMYCPADGPIVIPMSASDGIVDTRFFDDDPDKVPWGHYHEMGHAHQNPIWTFGGTGEVTVNIFTVWALHEVNGFPLDHPATRTDPVTAYRTWLRHVDEGAPIDKWKSKPFLALQTYAMLWHAFGFDPFFDVFERARALPAGDRPKNDREKIATFVRMMSEAVEHDLTAYFRAWGFTLDDALAAELSHLPEWMPTEPTAG